jgi:16S rRNA (cytosine967-C5)-methyltransferase
MTPGARLQSAIEILHDIFQSGRPADRIVENWARSNRYAGSKDRAAISNLVYTVLRRRSELSAATGHEEARLLAFAALALVEGEGVSALAALADGARHTPAPLTEEERAVLDAAALPGPEAAPWVRLNYPEWLHTEFEEAFGVALEREMAALMDRAPTDLRVNTLKANRETALAALEEAGLSVEPCPWSPWGLRLTSRGNLPALSVYRDGAVEIQDEGSQLACLLAGAKPGEQIVDLCAGGGGKSLALAAMMGNRGQIYACDTDGRRLAPLEPRAQRAGIRNLQTLVLGPWRPDLPDPDLAALAGRADRVLVDAPCSGTGAWRRSPDARWRLDLGTLEGYRAAQAEVLARAAALVRPGGRIVYVTCSLLPSENERQVEAFLAAHPDFRPVPWTAAWPEGHVPPPATAGDWFRLSPASTGTDGFFVAILQRGAGE